MTYNRDLQEDKERLFDSADTARACVRLMAAMLDNTEVNAAACRGAAADPALLATDLADYLVRKGMPFREAHHIVGDVVARAESAGKNLDELTLDELRASSERFGADATGVFHLEKAMSRRELVGAPGRRHVTRQLERWKKLLAKRA